jgi:uncharacterized protein (DUF983 family)
MLWGCCLAPRLPLTALLFVVMVEVRKGGDTEVQTPTMASGAHFRICPSCEESRLLFSGLNEARCPACDCEPSGAFLKTLRQIVALTESAGTSRSRPSG